MYRDRPPEFDWVPFVLLLIVMVLMGAMSIFMMLSLTAMPRMMLR